MTKLADMTVEEAASKAIELFMYAQYRKDVEGFYQWREPFSGTLEEFIDSNYRDSYYDDETPGPLDLNSGRIWAEFMSEDSSGERDGWTAKVVAEYGGEGMGDQYWMVVSISDGETTRYFRKDGWYASYDGGTLDSDTREVSPAEKVVTFYE